MRLQYLLDLLESHRLEVVLVPEKRPTHEMGQIRCVVSRNCDWYRKFCAAYPSKRGIRRGKFDTIIRRFNVERALRSLLAGQSGGIYGPDLVAIAERTKL